MKQEISKNQVSAAVELLAPARDRICGIAAIECGADAVYMGAPKFGAREKAGNSLDDIAAVAEYAHRYWARVYVTLNTLLRDDELEQAQALAREVHAAGADALIIQDAGLLECQMPPIPLIASTQMHSHTPEKVAFLEQVGVTRAILARELSLEEIKAIRQAAPRIELECFVHGALCVSYSGQCWLSYGLGGRSGNRGQCAQPCRKPYMLIDGAGKRLAGPKHLLSLRDLNLSDHLRDLLEAGVTSFKIEGRLKDDVYVANVVAHYRARLDEAMGGEWRRSSSGQSRPGFAPDVDKTFNRGYTTYFLKKRERMGSIDTPKMVGEEVGKVVRCVSNGIMLDSPAALRPGDGICFFDRHGRLCGTPVNAVQGAMITVEWPEGLNPGTVIYRNHDHDFVTSVKKRKGSRRIAVRFQLHETGQGLCLMVTDEDGNGAEAEVAVALADANKPEAALARMREQISKTGETKFVCEAVELLVRPVVVPVSVINSLRRDVLDRLRAAREQNRPRLTGRVEKNDAPYPSRALTYEGNVLNKAAQAFYRRHGVEQIEPAAESGLEMRGRKVMTTRYCIRGELGMCGASAQDLFLLDDDGNRLALKFDCQACRMEVVLESKGR